MAPLIAYSTEALKKACDVTYRLAGVINLTPVDVGLSSGFASQENLGVFLHRHESTSQVFTTLHCDCYEQTS